MGIIYCIAAMVCFSALYIVVAHSQKSLVDPRGLTLLAFGTGLLVSLVTSLPLSAAMYPRSLLAIGILIGATAGVGLLGISLSAGAGAPASVINTVASLALAIPILLAMLFYHQWPKASQSVGLLFAVIAIVLLNGASSDVRRSSAPTFDLGHRLKRVSYMALIFLGNGAAQFFQARLHQVGLDAFQSSALVMMYLSGAVFCLGMLLLFHGRLDLASLRYGAAVGLASYAGNFAVLRALATTPTHIVFPLVICGPIVLTVFYTRFVEGSRLSIRQSCGLACGVLAVLTLTVV